jgi:hypothetical protein
MTIDHVDQRTVRSALELANRAPSVHHSQPWRWCPGPNSVHLYADLRRWLPATDAEGRDLIVSCGAELHHLRVALGVAGFSTSVRRTPNPGQPDHLAAVELRAGRPSDTNADFELAKQWFFAVRVPPMPAPRRPGSSHRVHRRASRFTHSGPLPDRRRS